MDEMVGRSFPNNAHALYATIERAMESMKLDRVPYDANWLAYRDLARHLDAEGVRAPGWELEPWRGVET